ncbi:hypothetical protein B484DRAFT_410013, partial [Ochromonadaceae sp. CCMP2298]
MVYGLFDSLSLQDVSPDVVNSRAVTVADLLSDMGQVNNAAFRHCSAVLVDTVLAQPQMACVGSSASLITTALSKILERGSSSGSNSAGGGLPESLLQNVSLAISGVVDSCQSTLAIGEPPVSLSTPNLRITALVADTNSTLSVAQSALEAFTGAATSTLTLDVPAGGSLGLSLVQYNNNPGGSTTSSTSLTVQTTSYQTNTGRRLAGGRPTAGAVGGAGGALGGAVGAVGGDLGAVGGDLGPLGTVGSTLVLLNKKPVAYIDIPPLSLQVKCVTPTGRPYPLNGTCPHTDHPYSVTCPARAKGNYNITCPGQKTQ